MPPPPSVPARQSVDTTPGLAAPVSRAVAEDLEAIFPNQPAPAAGRGRLRLVGKGRAREREERRAEGRAGRLGALAAATFVGVSAGAMIAHPGGAGHPAAPAQLEAPAPVTLAAQSLPSVGPLPAASSFSPAAPFAPDTPPPAPLRAAAAVESAPAPARLQHAATHHAARPHHRAQRVAAGSCRGPGPCGHAEVMAADASLRRAYARAQHAGVPRVTLVGYHTEWSRLRHRASSEPRLVAIRYQAMASDLNRMSAHVHEEPAPAPQPSPWRRFRMEVASLWR
jgi:hypothetical protein